MKKVSLQRVSGQCERTAELFILSLPSWRSESFTAQFVKQVDTFRDCCVKA